MFREAVEVAFPGGKRIDAKVGGFLIQTDQATRAGGQGLAPEPFDLFLASIATCAGVFALGFCESRGLKTEGLALKMDCARDQNKKLIAHMRLRLTLPVEFPEKYRESLIRAIDLCAVKRHLMDPPDIFVEFTSGQSIENTLTVIDD